MEHWEGSQLNTAKEILAHELTELVHGKEEADKAEAGAKALFAGGADADIPTTTLTEADLQDGSTNEKYTDYLYLNRRCSDRTLAECFLLWVQAG